MIFYNCTNKELRIYDKKYLTSDYSDWVVRSDINVEYTTLPANPWLVPKSISIYKNTDPIKTVKYQKLSLPPKGYDYYIVTKTQLVLYTRQKADTSRMVTVDPDNDAVVLDDFLSVIGYTTFNLMEFD